MATIIEKGNGIYLVRAFSPKRLGGNGKQYSTTFRPKPNLTPAQLEQAIQKAAADFESQVRAGTWSSMSCRHALELAQAAESFVEFGHDWDASPNTAEGDRRFLHNVLLPFLVKQKVRYIQDIRHDHYMELVKFMRAPGFSKRKNGEPLDDQTVKRYATIFNTFMNYAVEMHWIDTNPIVFSRAKFAPQKQPTCEIYTQTECQQLMQAIHKDPCVGGAVLSIVLFTGVRRAEAAALTWSSLEERAIEIDKALCRKRQDGVKGPKSDHGYRSIPLVEQLQELLLPWKQRQTEWKAQRRARGLYYDPKSDYVLTDRFGLPYTPDTLTKKAREFLASHHLRHLNLHGFRHTFASHMMASGANLETIRSVLGEADYRMVGYYSWPLAEVNEKAMKTYVDYLLGKEDT